METFIIGEKGTILGICVRVAKKNGSTVRHVDFSLVNFMKTREKIEINRILHSGVRLAAVQEACL